MQIYFIRHGRTQYNLEHRFQGGRADSPLVASGIDGAKAAGDYLSTTQFSAVYSSPQQRALDTAKYIVAANQWQPSIQIDDDLREFDLVIGTANRKRKYSRSPTPKLFLLNPPNTDRN